MKIKTKCPKSLIEDLTAIPVLGSIITTPTGARMFEECSQIYHKLGDRVFGVKSVELLDFGLQGNDYVSEWDLFFNGEKVNTDLFSRFSEMMENFFKKEK